MSERSGDSPLRRGKQMHRQCIESFARRVRFPDKNPTVQKSAVDTSAVEKMPEVIPRTCAFSRPTQFPTEFKTKAKSHPCASRSISTASSSWTGSLRPSPVSSGRSNVSNIQLNIGIEVERKLFSSLAAVAFAASRSSSVRSPSMTHPISDFWMGTVFKVCAWI